MNEYQKNRQNNVALSIRLYLQIYADTSNKKEDRFKAMETAQQILEFVTENVNVSDDSTRILYNALIKILGKVVESQMKQSKMLCFKNEIGFLKMIE